MSEKTPLTLPEDILIIDDMHLGRPHVIASYLLLGDEPAIVDPGPASTLANLEAGLAAHGLRGEDLRHIVLTHIHLDHAGATGTLVRRYPQLRAYVHARGAPHMLAPERLVQSATRIYGDQMERLWGEFAAVPAERLTILSGGETLRLGGRALRAFDAPGHASHHLIYLDEGSGALFMGDNGGVCLPDRMIPRPATPPPDIDLEAWGRTLDLAESLRPELLLLAHFGPAYAPGAYLADYRAALARWAEAVRAGLRSGASEAAQLAALRELALADLGATTVDARELFEQASSVEMNWQGLARYWRKREG